jgi:tRNA-2-methylthio-N6-dimethylallyladenosine synthase
MFRYSIRPGTTAARYEDDVPEEEKIRRLNKLIALQQEISCERNQREIDHVHSALVEGPSRRDPSILRARTGGNKTVLFKGAAVPGDVVTVRVTAADAFTLHGEIAVEN